MTFTQKTVHYVLKPPFDKYLACIGILTLQSLPHEGREEAHGDVVLGKDEEDVVQDVSGDLVVHGLENEDDGEGEHDEDGVDDRDPAQGHPGHGEHPALQVDKGDH